MIWDINERSSKKAGWEVILRKTFVKGMYMKNSKKCGIKIWTALLAFLVCINGNISLLKAFELSGVADLSEESSSMLQVEDEERETAVEIWDAAGLCAMEEDPFGMYLLAADVDMSGVVWKLIYPVSLAELQGIWLTAL